MVINVGNYEKE